MATPEPFAEDVARWPPVPRLVGKQLVLGAKVAHKKVHNEPGPRGARRNRRVRKRR